MRKQTHLLNINFVIFLNSSELDVTHSIAHQPLGLKHTRNNIQFAPMIQLKYQQKGLSYHFFLFVYMKLLECIK